jgi:hypothetical protein
MKRIVWVLLPGFFACQSPPKKYTEEEKNARVDSLSGIKFEELRLQAMEDLDKRISIEVKVKVDSLLGIADKVQALPPKKKHETTP